jgi:hypothetical protein
MRKMDLGIDQPSQVQEAPVTGWTAQAELLAAEIREPGFRAAAVTASAWRAGVHAEATHGLVAAALTLTAGEAMGSLWDRAEPCPSDSVLLEHAAELEGSVAELAAWCSRIVRDCEAALAAAEEAAAAAYAAIGAAQSALGAADSPQAAATAQASLEAAQGALSAALSEIADCEAALEILSQVQAALAYALKCLRHVPDDFAQHYETPLAHRREQGPLPVSGAFLTAA